MSIETKKIEDIKEFKEIIGNNQRIMGLDVGSKRIGISISDPELKIAISLKTINRDKSIKLFNDLNNVVQKFKIGGLIFGMPLNMDGSLGKSAQSVTDTALLISQNLKIPYGFWDERLSSVAVERYFEKPKKSRKKNMINKKEIDNLAAAFILDGALQYINN
ncbi:MAG: Holliday junction resolvase RuvX [Candidatus Pelagibacterales bacterium]|jgi:putative Holliday junction resolvase|nr:Holliday junction resolvase RuvX [Pelagibacteraceae bacterium]|tara:strand:+ start:2579 stop:3064 length:486 start_codon:yes stop_codon:yes gene_type:complete